MSDTPVCQTCGTALAPGASASGLCPSCLFAQVLSDPGGADELEETTPSGLEPGTDFGRFRIEGLLGKGGMSTVYRAYEPELDRTVALKVLPAEFLHDETFAQRFRQEARVVAALEHPHIVPLYASGIDHGLPWMSMRLFAGGNLGTLLVNGPIDMEPALGILKAVAAALDYAHAHGVVHRDVKPSNILLDDAGHVCVGDFGLAHVMERSAVHTRTGLTAGTPQYMAPEQGLGRAVEAQADVYSLGIVAYEMLTGRPPFDGPSPVAVAMKHVNEPPPVPPRAQVPAHVWKVLEKALDKDPAYRWQTAAAFVEATDRALAEATADRHSRGRTWALRTVLAVAVVLAALALWRQPGERVPALPPFDVAASFILVTFEYPDDLPLQPPPPPRNEPPPRPVDPPTTPVGPPDFDSDVGLVVVGLPVGTSPPLPPPAPIEVAAASDNPDATDVALTPVASDDARPVVEVPPVERRRAEALYPANLRRQGVRGVVQVTVTVGPDGLVTDATIARSLHPTLDAEALKAARNFVFDPGTRNGVPDRFDDVLLEIPFPPEFPR